VNLKTSQKEVAY